MGLVEDYKRKKALEANPLSLMHIIHSTREKVIKFTLPVIEISKGDKRQYYNDGKFGPWIESVRYKFDQSPYSIQIHDDTDFGQDDGYASGFGDLWYWSYFATLSPEHADELFEKEKQRVYDKYLDPNRPEEPPIIMPIG